MLGDRVRRRYVQLSAIHNANSDVGLADIDIAHLLIGPPLGNRLLNVRLYFVDRNISPRAHLARGLRIIALRIERGDIGEGDQATNCREPQHHFLHSVLLSSRTGITACCARAASGHTAAVPPPSRMTKSRRRIPDTRASPLVVGPPHPSAYHRRAGRSLGQT